MIFKNRFDGDIDYLKSLHKRVNAFASDSIPDKTHALWVSWSNMKAMLDVNDPDYYSEVIYFTAVMAKKIDDYSKDHMLAGDQTISCILYEMDMMKPCVYELLN